MARRPLFVYTDPLNRPNQPAESRLHPFEERCRQVVNLCLKQKTSNPSVHTVERWFSLAFLHALKHDSPSSLNRVHGSSDRGSAGCERFLVLSTFY
jgi:hypothetical protein